MIDHKKAFNGFLKKELNKEQQKAVKAKDGVFLVIAGAGSGKTRVITARIANLIINENVQPQSIVGLTFTNKAANEMRERIAHFLEDKRELPFLGTFHSYCLRILQTNKDLLGVPFESIMDSDDQQKLLSSLIKRNAVGKRITAKKLSYNISRIKNTMIHNKKDVNNFLQSEPLIRDLYSAYEQEKKVSKCLDFDDLLIEATKLFEKNADFKKEFQKKIKHILVDEYQDTNVIQHLLLKGMALSKKGVISSDSLCVVGDEDQSIYSWRGATISNIINFKKDFPQTKTIKIEQNYRSVQPILDAANKIIKNNKNRNPKKLWTEKKGSDRIRTLVCSSEYQEGEIVSEFLKIVSKKQKLNSVAILYRAHYQSRAIEEALIRNSIPYKIIGGIQFYERKEIKDMLGYLRLILNPFDRVSFFRVINTPARGLGAKFEELFYSRWNLDMFSDFMVISEKLLEDKILTSVKQDSLKNFLQICKAVTREMLPSKAIEKIIAATGYIPFLKNNYEKEESNSRIDNLNELVRATKYMEENGVKTIAQFLDEVSLMQEHAMKEEQEADPVYMMTLHAAKGLEFDTVIIVGLEEGLLPNARSLYEDDALEEERRLFYVGITRAKERLLLTLADYRYAFGQATYQMPSRFIREIPQKLLSETDCAKLRQQQIDYLFYHWLGIDIPQDKKTKVFTFGSSQKHTKKSTKSFTPAVSDRKKSTKPVYARLRPGAFYPEPSRRIGQATDKQHGAWRKNQPVQHKKFGIGVIKKVEERNDGKFYLTVKFRNSEKKIDSKFVEKV